MRFRPAAELTPEAVAAIAEQVRVRALPWFARSGLIEADWEIFDQAEPDVEFDQRFSW
ncbi:MAG: hypothetical protein WBM40_19300 [Thiohalocapsa sp.]